MGEQLLALATTWAWCAAGLTAILEPLRRQPHGWHHPVAFGLLGALAGGEPEEVLTAYLHQAALGMIGAGVRAIPVGHTHGQQILAYLHDDIRELAATWPTATPRPPAPVAPSTRSSAMNRLDSMPDVPS